MREEGLTQPEAAQLLGRNKSWISRRLALLEKLCPSAREDLALGLLSPSMARQLTRLPVGNQEALLVTIRRDDLSALEVKQVVDLLLGCTIHSESRCAASRERRVSRVAWYSGF